MNIKVGDIYEDCDYHPVVCTEVDGDDIAGVSLVNGSWPRSCSIRHCGVRKMDEDIMKILIQAEAIDSIGGTSWPIIGVMKMMGCPW